MDVSTHYREEIGAIRLRGRFDFSGNREFREAVDAAISTPSVKEVEIDLSEVDYIDSAALGMLLISRERASNAGKHVVLVQARGTVRQVLNIANFEKLFTYR